MAETMIEIRQPGTQPALYERQLLETLDNLPAQEYAQRFKGNIKNAIDTIRFDTLRIIAGTAIGLTEKSLFSVALNQTGATADGGTTFKKDRVDTNMRVPNEMEYGNVLIVESFQIEAIQGSAITTADTVNRVTDPTAVAGATLSAVLNLLAALKQSWVEFRVGDRIVLEGRGIDFPAAGGIGGFGGGVEDGAAQNGFGFARQLREIVVLRPGEQFNVTYTPLANFTPVLDMDLVFKLAGVRLRPVG
jgi:hypothetical protein